jgi:uncharacterized protein DUF4115
MGPAGAYSVVLTASGSCWVMAADAATGAVEFTGTMSAGQTQAVPVSAGALRVSLGAASVMSMSVGGRSVQLPQGFRSPFVATFEPAT